jgi:acyl-CoA reductase-like NAD-dependent aldehyde dehydrogenase
MSQRLNVVSKPEKQFLDDAVFAAERAKGKKLSGPERKEVLRVARQQILSQREAAAASKAREQERHASEFTWSKPKPFRR